MAYAHSEYVGDGIEDQYTVAFPYLSRTHVKAYVDDVEDTTFTWASSTLIQLSSVPAVDAAISIQRVTPTTAFTDFVDGSTLGEVDLDNANLQSLYVAEEAAYGLTDAMRKTASGVWDADAVRVTNGATPTLAADLATKAYVDAVATDAGNVPSPDNPTDDGKELVASGGTFAWTTKSVTAAQVSDASANGRSLITAANYATMLTLMGLSANGQSLVTAADYAAMRSLMSVVTPPTTTNGDLWTFAGGVDARLAAGAENSLLGIVSGLPAYREADWLYLETLDGFDSTSDAEFTDLLSGYDHKFLLRNLTPATNNVTLGVQGSPTAGASPVWDATAGDYWYRFITRYSNTSTLSAGVGTELGTGLAVTAYGTDNTTDLGISGELILLNPTNAATRTEAHGDVSYDYGSGSYLVFDIVRGQFRNVQADLAVRFYFVSGFIKSGAIDHYIRKVG